MNKIIIGVDFDGTCTTHDYPNIGIDIGAIPVLRELVENGHKLILFTMRSKDTLKDAVDWFKLHNIELYGVNVNPSQKFWTESPKAYCQLYIDDAALFAPLVHNERLSDRPYINWSLVREELVKQGLI